LQECHFVVKATLPKNDRNIIMKHNIIYLTRPSGTLRR